MVEPPKFASGEYVPPYVDQLQEKSNEKQYNYTYNTIVLVFSIIGATASVIAAITGLITLCSM